MSDIEKDFDKKPRKKIKLIIALILIILVVAGLTAGYFLYFKNPKTVFANALDGLVNSIETKKFDTAKIKMNFNMELDADEPEIREINEILKDSVLGYEAQIDLKNKQEILNVNLDYKNENAISAEFIYDNSNTYIFLNEIFDKFIQLDMESDLNDISVSADMFDEIIKAQEKQDDIKKAIKIAEKEIKNEVLKEGSFSKETETIEINGKDVKVTKNIMELTAKDLGKVIKNVTKSLSQNDKFIELFDESPKEMLINLSNGIDTTGTTSGDKMIFIIYTRGFLNEFAGFEFEIDTEYEGKIIGLSIIKENKNTYSFKYEYPEISYTTLYTSKSNFATIEGKVIIEEEVNKKNEEEGKIKIELAIPNAGIIKLNFDYKVEYDTEIEKVDVKNSIKANELTEKDADEILNKLSEKPLIGDMVKNIIQTKNEITIQNNNSKELDQATLNLEVMMHKLDDPDGKFNLSTFEPEGFTKTDDGTYISQNGNKFKVDDDGNITVVEELNVNPVTQLEPTTTTTTSDNEVTNYTYKVSYSVPSNFNYQSSYSSNGYKYYKLGDYEKGIDATVSIGWYSDAEMEEYIKDEYDFEKDYSQNIVLSDIKTLEVNGKTFKYQILSYDYLGIKSTDVYVWYSINDEYVFRIVLEGNDMEPTVDIIKGFLNITVSKV